MNDLLKPGQLFKPIVARGRDFIITIETRIITPKSPKVIQDINHRDLGKL